MDELWEQGEGARLMLMGNEAMARGAMEAGVNVAAGYPGTPSSEIIESLAQASEKRNICVEWSVNEKVATKVAAAASYAGLRSLAVMRGMCLNLPCQCHREEGGCLI